MSKPPPMTQVTIVDDDSRASTPDELYVAGGKKSKRSQSFSAFAASPSMSVNENPSPKKSFKRKNSMFGRKPSTISEAGTDEGAGRNDGAGGDDAAKKKKKTKRTGMKFPTYEELNLLPEEIQATLLQLVTDFLRQRWYPILVLRQRRKQKKAAIKMVLEHQQVPTVTTAFLQQIPFFSRWANVESIIGALELQLFDKDEILCMQGEHSQSGIFFLVQGTISVRKLKKLDGLAYQPKGCGDHLTEQVRLLEPMTCYGEKIFLTEEPRMETLRTTSRCAVWVLKYRQFFSLFNSLPEDKRRAVQESAYERRREIMPKVFPIDEELLQQAPLFSDTPIDVLQQLASRMEPRVYAQGSTICKIGQSGNEMYYIGRGTIQMSMIAVEGDEPLVSTVEPGTIVGEMGVFSTKKRNITLLCQTACDVYAIDHEMISSAVSSQQHVMSRILRRAHALQTEYQEHSRKHHFDWISNIPLLNAVGGPKLHQAILDNCEGKVYPLHSSIISVAECCDRLVMFTRGKARISSMNVDLKVGEAIGFTCLIPHRWAYHVVAGETVEAIEISYTKLKKILVQFNVYEEVKQLSLGLLYPRVHPEAFQKAISTARHYCNPPCFPTSLDYDPKPFAARVSTKVSTSTKSQSVLSPLNKPKKRLENLFAPGPGPVQKAPVDTKSYAQAAAAFIEELDRELEDPLLISLDSEGLNREERAIVERNKQREAEARRQRVETRRRLTMDKPKQLARTRNTEEMERLSRKIRELERQQTASVPPNAKLNSTSMSQSGSPSPSQRHRSLPPLSSSSPSPNKKNKGDAETTQQKQANELKQSRTIAIQTDKSYLFAKSVKAQRERDEARRRDEQRGVMNDH